MTSTPLPTPSRHAIALAAVAALAALAGCGGGGDDNPAHPPQEVAISTQVIDGYLRNVLVCLDTNTNGSCDTGEPQGTSGAGGAVSFKAPQADANKYPLVASVTPDAVDEDGHTVTTSYLLSAPAGATDAITPLTTLVHARMVHMGEPADVAARNVQAALGLSHSPMQDFVAAGDNHARTTARVLALATQQALAQTAGATDSSGAAVPAAVANSTVQQMVLAQLSSLSLAMLDSPPANDAQAQVLARQVAAATMLTRENLAHTTAQLDSPEAVPIGQGYSDLVWLTYNDARNYTLYTLDATAAQNTPDSNNKRYFTESRTVVSDGVAQPWSPGVVAWTGSGWYNCPADHVHEVRTVPNSTLNESLYCGITRTRGRPLSESIANHSVRETVVRIRQAGGNFANWGPAPASIDPAATWPAGAELRLNIAYGQVGGDFVTGRAMLPPVSGDPATVAWRTASLADFVAWNRGDYDSANVSLQNINGLNSYSVLSQRWYPTADGSYRFKRYFIGFDSASQGARFYECEGDMSQPSQARHTAGSCTQIMSTTYTIEALGNNAQVLRFAQSPQQLDLRTAPTLVERTIEGSKITFHGRQSKAYIEQQTYVNHTAKQALLQMLNLPTP